MTTPREQLAGTSEKLSLAFSSLQAVEEEVRARTAGLGALPLSHAAARVSQAASMAKAEAVKVVKAADAAEAAAARAAEVVSMAQAARAAAAAKSAAAKAAVEAAEAAHAAAAALEADIEPPEGMAYVRMPSGGKSGSEVQGAMSCSGSQVEHSEFSVAIKAGESETSEDEGEHNTSPTREATPEAGTTHQERRQEDTHGTDRGEEEEEEEAPLRGKRKLGSTGEAPRWQSVRATGRLQPNYAESPTREPSKRQRQASEPGTGEDCEGGEAVQQGRRHRDYSSGTKVRHNAGVARGTAAEHGHCTPTKPDSWSERARPGIVRVVSNRCGHPGCMKWKSFGTDGSKKAEFCSQHAKKGMVNVRRKRCGHSGCITCPSFGDAGSNKAEFCSRHAREGMVDVVHKRCSQLGCIKQASYGRAGSRKLEFCSQHAENGMVDLIHQRCGHPECMIQPSFGKRGSTKREFCSQHAREGMISVVMKR